ncbi:cell division cycle protein 20 homolog B [Microtus pennsylvanicus]|uniref:cell division cycle protein 20 homolog B n=1 Tax=Microtus pennsylvanicus TaxID=10058 RepID=UPI003F6C0F0A
MGHQEMEIEGIEEFGSKSVTCVMLHFTEKIVFADELCYVTFRSNSLKRLSAEIPVASRPITTRGQPRLARDQETCSSALALRSVELFAGCRDGVRDESFHLRRFSSVRHFICHLEVELHLMTVASCPWIIISEGCICPHLGELLQLQTSMYFILAMEWSPWQSEAFAAGGGMKDGRLQVFNVNIGKCIQTSNTLSQFCSLIRLLKTKEIATSQGAPKKDVALWNCLPILFRSNGFFGHEGRVLPLVLSSEDTLLFSAASDGVACVWKGHQSPSQS